MAFTPEQVAFYRERGYVAGPRVLSDEQLDALRRRIEEIFDGRVPFPRHLIGSATQSAIKGQLPALKIVNLFRHDEVFASVMRGPLISALAHDLMPGPVRAFEDQVVYKPPHDDDGVLAWHQDYTYWSQVGPPELATCWIALDDATVANGCMHVIPGSHRWSLRYEREEVDGSDPDWLLKRPDVPPGAERTPVPCPVKAGHCHFHHCLTIHGSYGNRTDGPRRGYTLHLMPGDTRRVGEGWNPRQGPINDIPPGEVVRGPNYPDLPAPLAVS